MVVSIDIGGTFIKGGLINSNHQLVSFAKKQIQQAKNETEFKELLFSVIDEIMPNQNQFNVLGIGVCAPGLNKKGGVIENAVNLPVNANFPLRKLLSTKYDLPVNVQKDSVAYAIGEMNYGKGRDVENFIILCLGTGLGSSIVVNREIISNHSLGSEFGHTVIKEHGRNCKCGNSGCLETYISCTGIKRTLFELLATNTESSVFRDQTYNEVFSHHIHQAAIEGDSLAIEAFEITGKILGGEIVRLVHTIVPEKVILCGGLSNSGDFLLQPVMKEIKKNVLPEFSHCSKVEISDLAEGYSSLYGLANEFYKNYSKHNKKITNVR